MALESYKCEICTRLVEETVDHLLWHCPFAQQCRGLLNLNIVQAGGTFEKCNGYQRPNAKSVFHGSHHPCVFGQSGGLEMS
jgi:hypothetical protein